MKFKIGDKVRVTHKDSSWIFWMSEMEELVGGVHIIVGEWVSSIGTNPTLIVPGHHHGLSDLTREESEYGFPEHCLELAIKSGEQLLFKFMKEE